MIIDKKGSIALVALGSGIVIMAIAMYIFSIIGWYIMLIFGLIVEFFGGLSYLKNTRKKN